MLDRFYQAAKKYAVDVIIRITADCPLIDANESNKVLKEFMKGDYDYISNDSETYPNGLDTECYSFKALEDSWNESRLKKDREHVTSNIRKNQKKFRIIVVNNNSKSKLDYNKCTANLNPDLSTY